MKKEIADKWIAALRSGEYKQGTSKLRAAENRFCCLGVLTDLCIKEIASPNLGWSYETGFAAYYHDPIKQKFESSGALLLGEVISWAGMKTDFGDLSRSKKGDSPSLINLNDAYKFSFKEIADVIEKHWEYL